MCFLVSHVQILLQNVVWSGKYSNVFGALSDITECIIRRASCKPPQDPALNQLGPYSNL